MKTIAIAAALLAASTTAALAQPSYPMQCTGGPGMRIMVNHDVDGAGRPGATAMFVYFDRAPQGASAASPPPGSCAWMDRPLAANEPAVLWIKAPDIAFAFQVTGDGRIVSDSTGLRLSVEGSSREAQKWNDIVSAVLGGASFAVSASNSNGTVMAIAD